MVLYFSESTDKSGNGVNWSDVCQNFLSNLKHGNIRSWLFATLSTSMCFAGPDWGIHKNTTHTWTNKIDMLNFTGRTPFHHLFSFHIFISSSHHMKSTCLVSENHGVQKYHEHRSNIHLNCFPVRGDDSLPSRCGFVWGSNEGTYRCQHLHPWLWATTRSYRWEQQGGLLTFEKNRWTKVTPQKKQTFWTPKKRCFGMLFLLLLLGGSDVGVPCSFVRSFSGVSFDGGFEKTKLQIIDEVVVFLAGRGWE